MLNKRLRNQIDLPSGIEMESYTSPLFESFWKQTLRWSIRNLLSKKALWSQSRSKTYKGKAKKKWDWAGTALAQRQIWTVLVNPPTKNGLLEDSSFGGMVFSYWLRTAGECGRGLKAEPVPEVKVLRAEGCRLTTFLASEWQVLSCDTSGGCHNSNTAFY